MAARADTTGGFAVRPHPLFVLFFPARQYIGIALFTLCACLAVVLWGWVGFGGSVPGVRPATLAGLGAGVITLRLVWAVLQWATRAYGVETPSGGGVIVFSVVGVLNRTRSDVRVDALRNVVVDRPFFQRLVGLGSVGFATAGTGGYEVVWRATTSPTWDHVMDVGNVTEATVDLSKDNWFFGVRSYDAEGYRSPVSFPGIDRRR